MPNKVMATNEIAVCLAKADQRITSTKVKVILAGLDRVPLHGILGSDLIELLFDDISVLGV